MLNIRRLTYLVTLAERLSFARAAADLGITQSALTRSIQALENELGMYLFDRDRSGVSLTPQGRDAVDRASALLADAARLEQHLTRSAQGEAGTCRFGVSPMPARALLPALITDRLQAAPEVTNEVVVRDTDQLCRLLTSGDIEFFITHAGFAFDSPPVRGETLGEFPIGFFVRDRHPLLDDPSSEAKYPVLRSTWTGLPLPQKIRDLMLGAPHVIEDFGTLASVAANSDAIWFSSAYSVTTELRCGQLRELDGIYELEPPAVSVMMYHLEGRSPSSSAVLVKRSVQQHIAALARTRPPVG